MPGETIQEVLERVGDDPEKAEVALAEEQAEEDPRITLVSALEEIIASGDNSSDESDESDSDEVDEEEETEATEEAPARPTVQDKMVAGSNALAERKKQERAARLGVELG